MRDMGSSANSAEKFPLHQAVFNYDKREIKRLLESNNIRDIIDCQDVHGNTALLLAVMLGYCDVVADLLAKGADIRIESNDGWNALVEAISYGNRKMISCILAEQNHRSRLMLVTRKPHFIKLLSGLNDFYMELKWDFETWIPLLSNLLPSDTCKIYKRGTQLRVDTSLVDFHDLIWQRGDISLLFSPQNATQSIVIMDNKKRIFQDGQKLWKVVGSRSHEKEVDEIMSQDIVSVECSTKTIGFTRAMSGWLFRQEKKEAVGDFPAIDYMVNGLRVVTRKRREHLSDEDLKRNKEFMKVFSSKEATAESVAKLPGTSRRKDLSPPIRPNLSWTEYISASSAPILGRPHVEKTTVKEFRPVIAMSEEFPLPIEVFVDILEILSPFKKFEKLRQFFTMKMPPGFPVKLEVPLIATVSAKLSFEKFEWRDRFAPDFFVIPSDYKEEQRRFKELF